MSSASSEARSRGRWGGSQRPAHFWGLALASADLERTVQAFAPHVGANLGIMASDKPERST